MLEVISSTGEASARSTLSQARSTLSTILSWRLPDASSRSLERLSDAVHLEAGTYACTALFHSLDPETGSILGTAGAVITITINH